MGTTKKAKPFYHALTIDQDLCIGCANCMKACPTEAIRIREGKAQLYSNKCIDCGECYRVCPVHAIYIKQDDFQEIFNYKYRIALVPAIFIGQFSRTIRTSQVYSCLKQLGFTHIFEVEHGVPMVVEAYQQYIDQNPKDKPFISPFCPAILRLIQVRFPSLIKNIIKIKVPLDFAAYTIGDRLTSAGIRPEQIGVFYITPCAAKIASVKSPVEETESGITGVINMDLMFNKVQTILANTQSPVEPINHTLRGEDVLFGLNGGETQHYAGRSFQIDGVKNVIEFLEQVESGEIPDIDFLELRACHQSCAGGVLTSVNRFLAIERLHMRSDRIDEKNKNISMKPPEVNKEYLSKISDKIKIEEIKPRSLMSMGDDLASALRRVEVMQETEKELPGVNCCLCGAPTCHALAEDIARETASISNCVFYQENHDNIASSLSNMWGENKIIKTKKK
ncbi:MAG: 4Fe-4S binding protein [Bacteroidales bacterium]|nr:4Fe-4S binding protein [Bacteroidales bacterium]